MNPLTKVRLINELNEREADLGVSESVSWHTEYRDSAWVFVGGFPYELTEGDIICVFSQYGEIVNINLVRDKKTGKSKGFCFLCYEDQRSTILAVDNFNGIKIKGRTLRVDHVKDYKPPKDGEDVDEVTKRLREDGCAPETLESEEDEVLVVPVKKAKKEKKEKKKKKKDKKKAEKERETRGSSSSPRAVVRVKEEKEDAGYDVYNQRGAPNADKPRRTEDADRERQREGSADRERTRDRRRVGSPRRETDRERTRERQADRERHDKRRQTSGQRDGDRKRERERQTEQRRESDRVAERERR